MPVTFKIAIAYQSLVVHKAPSLVVWTVTTFPVIWTSVQVFPTTVKQFQFNSQSPPNAFKIHLTKIRAASKDILAVEWTPALKTEKETRAKYLLKIILREIRFWKMITLINKLRSFQSKVQETFLLRVPIIKKKEEEFLEAMQFQLMSEYYNYYLFFVQ